MKSWIIVAAAAALLGAAAERVWAQADPFDTARYDIGIRKNAEALAIVDARQIDVNRQTEEGYTLLHYAADAGNVEMVEALLARGADPTLRTRAGSTPYDSATGTAVRAVLARAMKAPAARVAVSSAPAPAAAQKGACAAVIAERANNGRSPAMRPVLRARDDIWYNRPDELAALLDDCVAANAKDDGGSGLLHIAASRDRVAAAKVLLAHGASRSLRDRDGKTPADYATSAEMKALLGPAAPALPLTGDALRRRECAQKQQADVALCSDGTCRMRTLTKQQQCLKTGRYY